MADDVLVSGGLFDITIRNAAPSLDGEKANVTNMALANGLMLMWDYGERVNGQSSLIAQDLTQIGQKREVLQGMLDWTPATFQLTAALQTSLNQLFDFGVGKKLTDQALYASFPGAPSLFGAMDPPQLFDRLGGTIQTWSVLQQQTNPALRFDPDVLYTSADGYFFEFVSDGGAGGSLRLLGSTNPPYPDGVRWPARTTVAGAAVGNWNEVQNNPGAFALGAAYLSADGVYFYRDGPFGALQQIDPAAIDLVFPAGMVVNEADITTTRRELEVNIESMTQVNQDKQAFLQDLVASLQKWFTFVNSVCDRRKRDADSIVGNFR